MTSARVVMILTGLWVCFLSVLIWHRISLSHQSPTFDAFEYFQKAKVFWDAVASHSMFNPFSLPPTTRPPGTILMSYPFGFSEDPRSFYFRSVAFAIVALVGALLIVTLRDKSVKPVWALFVAVGASALPMFYQFEAGHYRTHFFGLVDCFFAGVSALAVAAVIISIELRSRLWTAIACLVAAYSVTVKPTGIAIMALVGLSWFSGIIVQWFRSRDLIERKSIVRHLIEGCAFFAVVYSLLLFISITSGYMSAKNIAFAVGGQAVLRKDFNNLTLASQVINFYVSFGALLPLALVLPLVSVAFKPATILNRYGWHICCAIAAASFGVWIWLESSAGTQFRYFFPFALMALVFLAQPLGAAFSTSNRFVRAAAIVLMALPAIWTAVLLAIPQNVAVERWAGLSMFSGPETMEAETARLFIDGIRQRGEKYPGIYHIGMGDSAELAFISRGLLESLLHPNQVSLSLTGPVDWVRPSVVRIAEALAADYLLIGTFETSDTRNQIISYRRIDDYATEIYLFMIWGASLTEADGVQIVSRMPGAIFLKVTDRDALGRSLQKLRDAHEWRPEFNAANAELPSKAL